MPTLMSKLELSIVMASYNAAGTIAQCLAALEPQIEHGKHEVIIVDSSTDDTAEIIADRFPFIHLHVFDTRKFAGDARNFAITQARADLIACIDADCIANYDWIQQILTAHQSDKLVIGGVVDNANPDNAIGWAYYFSEFSQWMPGSRQGDVQEIPACCLSFKRRAFQEYGPFLERTYCSDTAFHWRLAKDGHKPRLEPAIRVAHRNPTRLVAILRHEIQHGRYFASVRAGEHRFTPARRLIHVITSPLLPLLLFFRVARCVVECDIYRHRFRRAAPLVFLAKMAWSCGELLGYLSAGPKSSTVGDR